MNKGLSIEFLLANDEIPKCFLYLWSLNKHSAGKYGTDVTASLLQLTCIHTGSAFC